VIRRERSSVIEQIVENREFLPRDAMHSADYAVTRCLSVRLSVCLSVTCRYSADTVQHISKLFSLSGRHTGLVFAAPNITEIFQRERP